MAQELDDPQTDRWRILLLSCIVLLAENFCYDTPAMIHDRLRTYSGLDKEEFPWFFNALYSAYSFPNLIVPLIGGWMMDKVSVPAAITLLSGMSFLGQFITTWGIIGKTPSVSLLGRVFFGMGTESMGVAQSIILTQIFNGKEIAFALALNVSSSRLGTILNNWLSPFICQVFGVPATFITGLTFCLVSVVCSFELARCISNAPHDSRGNLSHGGAGFSLSSGSVVKKEFWIVAATCVAGYCSVLPFTSVFMAYRPVGLTQQSAGQVVSVVFVISAIITPYIGQFIDRFGGATYVLVVSGLLLSLAHTMYKTYDHVLVMVFLGLAYAGLVAAVWPLVPATVPENKIGFGYGMMTALQNFGLTVTPLLLASIKASTGSYYGTRWVFVGSSLITVGLSVWLAHNLPTTMKSDCIDASDIEDSYPPLLSSKCD